MTPAYRHVLVERREQTVIVITLNRPERRNALSLEMMGELESAIGEAARPEDGARAVVIAAAGGGGKVFSSGHDLHELRGRPRAVVIAAAAGGGGKVFSSGHDLHELRGRPRAEYDRLFAACTALMTRIQAVPVPVIAAVEGLATAAGCQLVATCDLAVAGSGAAFATPGVRIGLFCTTPMVALTRAVGRKRAMEMLLTGRAIDAETAASWGLVNCVVAAGEAEAHAMAWARTIAEASAGTIATGKRAFYRQIDAGQSAAYAMACEVMAGSAEGEDAQEGIGAFLDKRRPVWK